MITIEPGDHQRDVPPYRIVSYGDNKAIVVGNSSNKYTGRDVHVWRVELDR